MKDNCDLQIAIHSGGEHSYLAHMIFASDNAVSLELAAAMDMPLADYQKMLQDARGHQLISFEDLVEDSDEDYLERHLADEASEPSRLLEEESLRRMLVQGIEALPEREKLMMALYYE